MTNPSSDSDHRKRFPIVGRDSRIDLAKYTVQIRGQAIIDYEKLQADNPALYKEIVASEFEADRKQQEELDEILAGEEFLLYTDKPATIKYFYLPVFVSNPRKDQDGKDKVNVLTFSDDSGQPMVYASRVLPGQTLPEAVTDDLRRDFEYDGNFQILANYFYDEAPDKHGAPLPRIAVLIKVDEFPAATLSPAGMKAYWSADGFERLREYRFKLG